MKSFLEHMTEERMRPSTFYGANKDKKPGMQAHVSGKPNKDFIILEANNKQLTYMRDAAGGKVEIVIIGKSHMTIGSFIVSKKLLKHHL